MKTILPAILLALLLMPSKSRSQPAAAPFVLVLHGGAGVIPNEELTPGKEAAARATLAEALRAGHAILKAGGASLEAVTSAIRILEDSPIFNAGRGSVLTAAGTVEMDASVMNGATGKAGAVAAVKLVKNPIDLARLVMEKTPHVMLAGDGAEVFARQQNQTMMPAEWFITDHRRQQLERMQKEERDSGQGTGGGARRKTSAREAADRMGTVGAVALDQHGNLAAGTSTGGMANKRFGRVGDSPIIGAGTWADNRTCAVSGTGHGEFFMRSVVAYDIAALMEYKGLSVAAAANEVVMKKLKDLGGRGGVIAVDRQGNIALPFNSEGMYRGYVRADGKTVIAIRPEP